MLINDNLAGFFKSSKGSRQGVPLSPYLFVYGMDVFLMLIEKRQYISKGGILTLIRSMLCNMPIYIMSLFQLSKGAKKRLEEIQRDFLWEGGNSGRKPHLVNWKIVCVGKEEDDLGIRSLSTMDKALLGKWT